MGEKMQSTRFPARQGRIALIGNYLPRICGIATFTTDLLEVLSQESPQSECWAVAMNDVPEGYNYPSQVRFEVNQNRLQDYQLAADFLNMNMVEVVCLQHEFGIFGGKWGSHILALLQELRMPLVTTLHTVLTGPNPDQQVIMKKLVQLSDRMVVMSDFSGGILKEQYGLNEDRIIEIPHGIPDIPFIDPNFYKDQFGVEGRKVLLSFGLISPGKGLEHVIDAMPEVIARYPETVYIILGATHPNIKRESGEQYHHSLQQRARELKVEKHIIFHNRFVSLKELSEFLICADIYITPYLNKEQAVSGTLAYAMGAGKAIISTPYWYAEQMLAEGRGILVPFADPSAISTEVMQLFDNEVEMNSMRERVYKYSRDMVWKEVARSYLEVFVQMKQERLHKMIPGYRTWSLDRPHHDLPEIKFDHLRSLTDDTGILQHARFVIPDRKHGYATDDNARALIAVLLARDKVVEEFLDALIITYLGFIDYAFNEKTGRFRNFMSYDRSWLEGTGSEDSHGRALWALGMAVSHCLLDSQIAMAMDLFGRALPALRGFNSSRSCAFSLIGINAYLHKFGGDRNARKSGEMVAERLFGKYKHAASEHWPWIEEHLSYANGKIPNALILGGKVLGREEMVQAGLRLLDWLARIQKDSQGYFVPVGNQGWYRRDGEKARYDQQPIEAQAMIEACIAAYEATGDDRWIRETTLCFEWFLGRNDLQMPICDYRTGGCRDGLHDNQINQNQGAESTLAWLISLLSMYNLYSHVVSLAGKLSLSLADEQGTSEVGEEKENAIP